MTQQHPQPSPPRGDPWHAFGYLVSGVFLYGGLGWFADRWLGTSFLVAVGILVGAGLGIFMTWKRFNSISGGSDNDRGTPPGTDGGANPEAK